MTAPLQSCRGNGIVATKNAAAAAARGRQRGLSLIEVLVAVLIFSLGLIGLAGLLVISAQANRSAYLRTQASFLALAMADRMRANPAAVWAGRYNSSGYPMAGAPPACASAAGCSPAQVAVRDQVHWSRQLAQFLPAATAAIDCNPATSGPAVAVTQYAYRPPYSGTCSMTLTWTESSLVRGGAPTPQIFASVFQP